MKRNGEDNTSYMFNESTLLRRKKKNSDTFLLNRGILVFN